MLARLLALGVLAALAPSLPAQSKDPLQNFQAFVKALASGRQALDEERFHEVELMIADVRLLWAVDSARAREVACALLDFVGLTLADADELARGDQDSRAARLREQCADALRAHQDAAFERFLAREVLALAQSQPLARRRAALWLLAAKPNPGVLLALLGAVRDPDVRVRDLALEALTGYQDPGVHGLFLSLLLDPESARGLTRAAELAERHFATVRLEGANPFAGRLQQVVQAGLVSRDWRAVSRAIALSRPLEHALAVPPLLDALEAWDKRAKAGLQALRIQHELEVALAARAEQSYGFDVARWRAWWAAVEQGEQPPPRSDSGQDQRTSASFFALKPWSDRVLFVLDRSGSMLTGFDVHGSGDVRSRWDEAVAQVLQFMTELGPKARFDLVVFHDFAETWMERLVPSDEASRKAARLWLAQKPRGGTLLRAGVERALGLGRGGDLDLGRLEADTVIVLCDGATQEGPGWVPGFLARLNSRARLVFHGVQIGDQGDGTLERLSRGSGGQFVRIDP